MSDVFDDFPNANGWLSMPYQEAADAGIISQEIADLADSGSDFEVVSKDSRARTITIRAVEQKAVEE